MQKRVIIEIRMLLVCLFFFAYLFDAKADNVAQKIGAPVSEGASYKVSRDAEGVPANVNANAILTDGITGLNIGQASGLVYPAAEGLQITVDLKKVRKELVKFSLHGCASSEKGMVYSPEVTFSVSGDGTVFTEIGRVPAPLAECPHFNYDLMLANPLNTRYFRASLSPVADKYFYLDEITAYGTDEKPMEIYPALSFPDAGMKKSYWNASDADYSETKNLLSGLSYQVTSCEPLTKDMADSNTGPDSTVLTDGVYSDGYNIHNGKFFKVCSGSNRALYFDLGACSSVREFTMGVTYTPDWSVFLPENPMVYVSADANTWYRLGKIEFPSAAPSSTVKGSLQLAEAVEARYICFTFDVIIWIGIDETEVIGTKKVSSSTAILSDSSYPKCSLNDLKDGCAEYTGKGWAAPSEKILGGVHDMFLAYIRKNESRTEEDLMYQIGYFNEKNQLTNTMFDGILFLMSGMFPSELGGGTGGILRYNKSDADWLVNVLFEEGKNIDALDRATEALKKQLKLSDSYKVKYFVSLYRPDCEEFGDIDGDGTGEDLSTNAGKIKVLKYCIDCFEKERKKHSYRNVEFAGYYWYNESCDAEKGDLEIINATADYIHRCVSQLFWIPYYSAQGWKNWKDFGFDTCCLQPNYAFRLNRPVSRIATTAANAERLNMSIEIEMDGRAMNDPRYGERYFSYLSKGKEIGFMTRSMHLYYMDSGSLKRFATSDNPYRRLIYDYTYGFIKGMLVTAPDKLKDLSLSGREGEAVAYDLMPDNDGTYVFSISSCPSHGTVSVTPNGALVYYPEKGYTGKDTFSITYNRMMENAEPTSVTVEITKR